MQTNRFTRYTLRTVDVPDATAFYAAVLGDHGHPIFPLHENARARGARPHWLGRVEVDDPTAEHAAVAAFEAAGAQRLGPHPDGGTVLRDPGGALLAIGAPRLHGTPPIGWHSHYVHDAERTAALYQAALGWTLADGPTVADRALRTWSAGPAEDEFATFSATSPGIHPQWLFYFPVPSLDRAVDVVRARGGLALDAVELSGRRFVACDDPQGAAFGLVEG